MSLNRKLTQAAFLCGALVMPALAYGAEIFAEDAFLARISTEVIPRMQREYMQTAIRHQTESAMDVAAFRAHMILEQTLEQLYLEGLYDGVSARLTAELFERWELSPSVPYHLEATDIPECADGSVLLPICR